MNTLSQFFWSLFDRRAPRTLRDRMCRVKHTYNSEYVHPYRTLVFTLASTSLNKSNSFDNMDAIHRGLVDVGRRLHKRFNPTLVYIAKAEIHMVFHYVDDDLATFEGNGRVLRMTSRFSSVATHLARDSLAPFLGAYGPEFSTERLEFTKPCEALNFLVWKQSTCYKDCMYKWYNHLCEPSAKKTSPPLADVETFFQDLKTKDAIDTPLSMDVLYGTFVKKLAQERERASLFELHDGHDAPVRRPTRFSRNVLHEFVRIINCRTRDFAKALDELILT